MRMVVVESVRFLWVRRTPGGVVWGGEVIKENRRASKRASARASRLDYSGRPVARNGGPHAGARGLHANLCQRICRNRADTAAHARTHSQRLDANPFNIERTTHTL